MILCAGVHSVRMTGRRNLRVCERHMVPWAWEVGEGVRAMLSCAGRLWEVAGSIADEMDVLSRLDDSRDTHT